MARGGIGTDQKIAVLGVAVLLLGALSLVALNQGARFGPKQASPAERNEFQGLWQERVRRLLLEFADDPAVIQVCPA